MRVPTIDVSAFVGGEAGVEARARVVSEVREACERAGLSASDRPRVDVHPRAPRWSSPRALMRRLPW